MTARTKFVLLMVFIIAVVILTRWTPLSDLLAQERIVSFLKTVRTTWWAPFIFVLIYIAGCLLAMPSVGLSVLGGVIFGFFPGLLYNLIAINLGSSLAFGLSRILGRDFFKKLFKSDKMQSLEEMIERRGLRVVIVLRILPIFPFNVVNFGSAWFKLRYRDYCLGSLIGMFPATLAFTYFANAVFAGERNTAFELMILLGVVAAILLAILFLPKPLRRK